MTKELKCDRCGKPLSEGDAFFTDGLCADCWDLADKDNTIHEDHEEPSYRDLYPEEME